MPLVIDDAAQEFGKTLGGQAAQGLCDWIRRLWNAEGIAREQQLAQVVEPLFGLFREIHTEYQSAFQSYRARLTAAKDEQDILAVIDQIEADLRFTASARVDLLSQLKQASDSVFAEFVRAMVDFMVSNESSLSGTAEDALAPPEIACQVMRRGLIADLRAVTGPWAFALDPAASGPPLYGEALEDALAELAQRHGIATSDPEYDDKLRTKLAVQRLDARMDAMTLAYKRVREAYDQLRTQLQT